MDTDNSPFTSWRFVLLDLFIGREEEINEIMGAVGWVSRNNPGSVFIIGDRGIGKSFLVSFGVDCAQMVEQKKGRRWRKRLTAPSGNRCQKTRHNLKDGD